MIISSDLEISEAVLMRAKKIKCIVFDVDGVMTDGSLGIGDDGQEFKNFNITIKNGCKLL